MAKGKRGRPRAEGERYPCGKLKKEAGEGVAPAQWDRIRTDIVRKTGDESLRSEVGRLFFHGELTERQRSTALWVAQIYGAFEAPFALKRSARSPAYEIGIRGMTGHSEDNPEAERDFFDLQEHIPFSLRSLIEQLCVENCAISSLRLDEIRWLLSQLADVRKRFHLRDKRERKLGQPRPPRKLNIQKPIISAVRPEKSIISRKPQHFDRPFAAMTVGELFPDLDHDEISRVIAYRHALKDRADYRAEQSVRGNGRRNISENRAA